ncbi:C40 family peptidase [Streptomyces filamentosus]|uniref:C40 family peptidase n=1 Tax=Streptomyces filamentosus TaxID=67294 RepID=UPI00123AE136|nr:C40 family peptidase [Streptomyces filamentosus]KAA6219662.1 NlpC/P60 family protein [Streptomyces filamentosus]
MSRRLLRTVCTGALAALTALAGTAAAPPPPAPPAPLAPLARADPAAEPVGPVDPDGTAGLDAGAGLDPRADSGADSGADPGSDRGPAPDPATAEDDGTAEDPGATETAGTTETPEPPGSADAPPDDAAALPPAGGDSAAALLTRLRTLYRQTEEAAERFNATEEALKLKTAEARRVAASLEAARAALARGRAEAGRLAREQYQGRTGYASPLRLLFADDPQSALDARHLMDRTARERAAALPRLRAAERRAAGLAAASRTAVDRQRTLAAQQRTRRDQVRKKLAEVEALIASLSPGQLTRLAALERAETAGAQRELLGSGALGPARAPSRAGAEALRFAVDQLGKPYEWGAEGPEAYDCSGLTQRAWAAAGREVPRTSQEQWARLPRVGLDELRPGDLVVYFPGATHVALYLGDGLVVQAPRPGGRVKASPLAANPLLGAVRPDPGAASLESYTPPVLPEGAREGSDEGYDTDGGHDREDQAPAVSEAR